MNLKESPLLNQVVKENIEKWMSKKYVNKNNGNILPEIMSTCTCFVWKIDSKQKRILIFCNMGVRGIFRFVFRRLLEIVIIVALITFIPNLPPYAKYSDSIRLPPKKPLEGKLAPNEKLKDVEKWHKGDLLGPENFADYNGELYTSLYGGDIVKLVGNDIKLVAKTGKPCNNDYEESICGRPLGMQFLENGDLFVADAYYGIMKVDVKTGKKQVIIGPDQKIGGKTSKIFNSIAVAKNGDIFWTDSSTDFGLENGIFVMLADPTGRLVHYDAKSKTNKVLIENLHFANGVLLADDEEFVIVAETGGSRIYRYYLKGPKKGTHDVFIDGLPGLPDNLKSDGQGGVFVSMVVAEDEDHLYLSQIILPFPRIRKFVSRIFGIFQLGFETLNKVYPCEFAKRAIHSIGHFTSTPKMFTPPGTIIIRLSRNGEILESISTNNKEITYICEPHIFKGDIYLASPFNDYIGRIPLSKVGWEHLGHERKKRDVPVAKSKAQAEPTIVKPSTTVPPKEKTPPKQKTSPPTRQQTPPPPPPPPHQEKPTNPSQQTPPKQTPPPQKQHTTPPPKQQTPPPKPTANSSKQTPPLQSNKRHHLQKIKPHLLQSNKRHHLKTTTPPPKQQTHLLQNNKPTSPKQQAIPKLKLLL
ncbi:hypothetical protein JTB14_016538 [Gonioctena quinquepunctata]|nr:hypothetical protein JTB14_016538 [Gonioctena quinquepunctata]